MMRSPRLSGLPLIGIPSPGTSFRYVGLQIKLVKYQHKSPTVAPSGGQHFRHVFHDMCRQFNFECVNLNTPNDNFVEYYLHLVLVATYSKYLF